MKIFEFVRSLFKKREPKRVVPVNGMQAHEQGFEFTDNPFPKHTPDHSIWRDDYLWHAGIFR